MYKLGHLQNGNWLEHVYPAVFDLSEPAEEMQRLVAGVPNGNPTVFQRLVESLAAPYYVLYVLHTPRGDELAGRYQRPAINAVDFRKFMIDFSSYLASDARFDIWAYSSKERATIVWDRHNQIFGYGPLPRFALTL